tara:strand:+ start:124 stop:1041 length:918 start_codon:yes stop_codon:yes gene_type:complete
MPKRTVTIILNTASGRRNGQEKEEALRAAFRPMDVDVHFVRINEFDTIEDASRVALKDPDATVVVSGGDGTICGASSVLLDADRPFGIIPSGTFNYFARSLNLPEDFEEAARVIIEGQEQPVSAAVINDRMFLNNASIGAYAAILQTREGVYKKWGRSRIAAYWSVIKALATFRAPLKLTVTMGGVTRKVRTSIIFAINNAFQLQQMGLDGEECIKQGKLVVLIAPDTSRMGLFKHAAALAFGVAKPQTDYEMHCGDEIDITIGRRRRAVARDGELERMKGPFKLRILDRPLKIIVPKGQEAGIR